MPAHDWTHIEGPVFHDFRTTWVVAVRNALNEGLLPPGFYALIEQHAGRAIADVLTLHESSAPHDLAWLPAFWRDVIEGRPPVAS